LQELADEIAASGVERPVVIAADVTASDAPAQIRDAAHKSLGRVDILINAAGGSRPMPWDSPEDCWSEGMTVNFTALRRLTTTLLPGMINNRWGRVINITGTSEPRGVNVASAAKAAVHAWSKGLSRDIGKHSVTVNCLSPGRIHSEQIDERLHPDPEEQRRFAEANIPLGYFGDPEDMAYLIAFLASPLAHYITGELIYVDGGMHRFAF
jgi:3-oxoacyl-[acyl-carrier protein] reductase